MYRYHTPAELERMHHMKDVAQHAGIVMEIRHLPADMQLCLKQNAPKLWAKYVGELQHDKTDKSTSV